MRLLTTLTCCLFLLCYTANAQKPTFAWGEEGKKIIQSGYYYVKGKGSDVLQLSFKTEKHGRNLTVTPTLVRFNKRLENIQEKVLPEIPAFSFNSLANVGGKLLMFTRTFNKDDESTSFFCQAINNETLEFEGEKLLLEKYQNARLEFAEIFKRANGNIVSGPIPGGNPGAGQENENFLLSEDSSKVLLFASALDAKNQDEKFYFTVYDKNMSKLWQKAIDLPYQSEFTNLLGSFVTNDGKVCIAVKHYDKGTKKEEIKEGGNNIPAYKTKILVYNNADAVPVEYTINIGDKFLHSFEVSADNTGNFNLFGLYQQNTDGNINGYFTGVLNLKNRELPIENYTAFPTALVDMVKLDKQVNKKDNTPGIGSSFMIKKLLKQDDGSRHYLLEFYENSSTFQSGLSSPTGMASTTNWFVYGDIIDIKIAPDKSSKVLRLPKNQISAQVSGSSSFEAMIYKDKPVFFYNDYDTNLALNVNEAAPKSGMGSFGGKVLIITVPDDKGGFKRNIIYDNSGNSYTPDISAGMWIEKNKLAFSAYTPLLVMTNKAMPGIMEIK